MAAKVKGPTSQEINKSVFIPSGLLEGRGDYFFFTVVTVGFRSVSGTSGASKGQLFRITRL